MTDAIQHIPLHPQCLDWSKLLGKAHRLLAHVTRLAAVLAFTRAALGGQVGSRGRARRPAARRCRTCAPRRPCRRSSCRRCSWARSCWRRAAWRRAWSTCVTRWPCVTSRSSCCRCSSRPCRRRCSSCCCSGCRSPDRCVAAERTRGIGYSGLSGVIIMAVFSWNNLI